MERCKDTVGQQRLMTKRPVVPGGHIYQDKGISKTTNSETVTKSNIHMNSIQIEITGAVK
jgi:hypothetical protein